MQDNLHYFTRKYAGPRKVAVNAAINNDDEMYSFLEAKYGAPRAKMFYYKLGSDLTRTILQIANWRFPGKTGQINPTTQSLVVTDLG